MELIKIQESKGGKRVVSARELYSFLSIDNGAHFVRWSKTNIEDLFEESIDYQTLRHHGGTGGRPSIDYAITIDCAKEVSMMSRCEKGKKARKYFIEVEKKYKQGSMLPDFNDPVKAARAWADEVEKSRMLEENKRLLEALNIEKNRQIRDMHPKAVFADAVQGSSDSCLVGELAKILKQNGINIGQNRLFEWLRENGYLGRRGEYYNIPTQRSMNGGLFEIKETVFSIGDGEVKTGITAKVTGKGQVYFVNLFAKMQTRSLKSA